MASSSQSRGPETWPNVPPSGVAAAPAPPGVAAESRTQQQAVDQHDKNAAHHHSLFLSTDEHFSQSDPRSAEGSQASNATSASDQVFTPTPSDDYNNNTASNHDSSLQSARDMSSQDSQLRQLSALAATRDRMQTDGHDAPAASRKRMADGEVKSPIRGHSRNTSTMSMASTTSTIGDVSIPLYLGRAVLLV